jgi:hypothetical protein
VTDPEWLIPADDPDEERRDCWDVATYFVSLIVRPNQEGLLRSDSLGDQAAAQALNHPELVKQLITAIAVFASELPADAVRVALDRLTDEERNSMG